MGKLLATNVKRLCKEQEKQMKDLAADMGIDPASLTRALNGNPRLDTIERIASALGVSIKSLFDNNEAEGFIKLRGKLYQIHSLSELKQICKDLL